MKVKSLTESHDVLGRFGCTFFVRWLLTDFRLILLRRGVSMAAGTARRERTGPHRISLGFGGTAGGQIAGGAFQTGDQTIPQAAVADRARPSRTELRVGEFVAGETSFHVGTNAVRSFMKSIFRPGHASHIDPGQ